MNKRKRIIIVLAILLMITIGNYFRITSTFHIRAVDFLSIFAIGALAGILINQLFEYINKDNSDNNSTTAQ